MFMKKSYSKIISSLIVVFIYLLAFLFVYFLFPMLPFSQTMINVLIADVIATIVVFTFSIIFSNSSVYDPYWSVAPPFIVVYLMTIFPDGNSLRQWTVLALVLFWSTRLTVNWLRGWQGFNHQDWRYTNIAEKTGIFYWPVSFLGIHLMPTIFVFLGCLPLWYSMSSTDSFNIYDIIAALWTFTVIMLEWIADEQLLKFKKSGSKESFMQSGLWAFSRHPNYLGEISFWIGIFLFLLSSTSWNNITGYWTVVGALSMVFLFLYISIPMMEKRNINRKPGYQGYINKVPSLLPRFFF